MAYEIVFLSLTAPIMVNLQYRYAFFLSSLVIVHPFGLFLYGQFLDFVLLKKHRLVKISPLNQNDFWLDFWS